VDKNIDIQKILKEISDTLSESLSAPEIMDKLEQIQKSGYHLYLVLENGSGNPGENSFQPFIPIKSKEETFEFDLKKDPEAAPFSDGDKIFLRTLKIKSE
jgi:hypothetical protein